MLTGTHIHRVRREELCVSTVTTRVCERECVCVVCVCVVCCYSLVFSIVFLFNIGDRFVRFIQASVCVCFIYLGFKHNAF